MDTVENLTLKTKKKFVKLLRRKTKIKEEINSWRILERFKKNRIQWRGYDKRKVIFRRKVIFKEGKVLR